MNNSDVTYFLDIQDSVKDLNNVAVTITNPDEGQDPLDDTTENDPLDETTRKEPPSVSAEVHANVSTM